MLGMLPIVRNKITKVHGQPVPKELEKFVVKADRYAAMELHAANE